MIHDAPGGPLVEQKKTLWHSRKCLLSYMKRGFGPSQKHQLLAKLKPRRHPKCFQNPPKMEAKNEGAPGPRPATWPLVPRDMFFKLKCDFWPPTGVPESPVWCPKPARGGIGEFSKNGSCSMGPERVESIGPLTPRAAF